MKNGQTILESTYFRGFEYCRTFILSGSSFSFGKIPVFDRWMLKNKKNQVCHSAESHTDTLPPPPHPKHFRALATDLLRALPTPVSTVIGIVLSDFVFYCDHFPKIWEPRIFFSIEIQWFNMEAPKNN